MSFGKARQRIESGNIDREDFMSYVLRHNDDKSMSSDEMGENANILIIAGSETTATLLSGTTFWLLKTPQAYKRLCNEIRTIFQSADDITATKLGECKYLSAVWSEGLRMYPPVPSGLGRHTPAGGDFVDGYWLPEGVRTLRTSAQMVIGEQSWLTVFARRLVPSLTGQHIATLGIG